MEQDHLSGRAQIVVEALPSRDIVVEMQKDSTGKIIRQRSFTAEEVNQMSQRVQALVDALKQ